MIDKETLKKRKYELTNELAKADQEVNGLAQRVEQVRTARENIRGALILLDELLNQFPIEEKKADQ